MPIKCRMIDKLASAFQHHINTHVAPRNVSGGGMR
jgi:hypothetical protein